MGKRSRNKFSAKKFGELLRTERERLGLTQVQFSELAGVRRVTQLLYERAERHPDTKYLEALDENGIDVLALLLRSQVDNSGAEQTWIRLTPETLVTLYSAVETLGGTTAERLAALKALAAAYDGRSDVASLDDLLTASAAFSKKRA